MFDKPAAPPRIASIGIASWDQLIAVDRYPNAGGYAIVERELAGPGGTTTNTAVTLARLGAVSKIRAQVGDDAAGRSLCAALASAGVDTEWVTTTAHESTDRATVIVSATPRDRTVYWHRGAKLVRGDRIDIAALFAHHVVFIDVDDAPLRRFLIDLPAHTLPATRLLGSLTYLDEPGLPDAFDQLMRHDVVVGNARELIAITGAAGLDSAIAAVQRRMPGENLRAAVITRGPDGSLAFTRDEIWTTSAAPVDVVDTTGAGDAFAGGTAFGMACRWPWPDIIRFAGAVAGISITGFGAQTALPSFDEVIAFLTVHP